MSLTRSVLIELAVVAAGGAAVAMLARRLPVVGQTAAGVAATVAVATWVATERGLPQKAVALIPVKKE
jgi:uncharacterized protein (DUF697 family)